MSSGPRGEGGGQGAPGLDSELVRGHWAQLEIWIGWTGGWPGAGGDGRCLMGRFPRGHSPEEDSCVYNWRPLVLSRLPVLLPHPPFRVLFPVQFPVLPTHMQDLSSPRRSIATSKGTKKVGAPKAKGAVRAKSGCYTCRIRRKVGVIF